METGKKNLVIRYGHSANNLTKIPPVEFRTRFGAQPAVEACNCKPYLGTKYLFYSVSSSNWSINKLNLKHDQNEEKVF